MLGHLPEEILMCKNLKTLELSNNNLTSLPTNLGDLVNLTEIAICDNQITSIPHSIGNSFNIFNFYFLGQLKKLEILKVAKNLLTDLTPAICSCVALTDLVLSENKISVRILKNLFLKSLYVFK